MLHIRLYNDGTGDEDTGHYNYQVNINYDTVGKGRIEGHNRQDGWRILVIKLAEQIAKEMIGEAKQDEES